MCGSVTGASVECALVRWLLTISLLLSVALVGCVGDTDPATDVTNVSATLNGHGRTTGQPATWWWEYSSNKSDLGTAKDTEVCGEEADRRCGPASSPNDVALHNSVDGLTPNTTYWFRFCGQDEGGTPVCGNSLSFKTLAGTSYAFDRYVLDAAPVSAAVDRDENLYFTGGAAFPGSSGQMAYKVSPTGQDLAGWGLGGNQDGDLVGPRGIAVDADLNVYVADTGNHRIQKFTIGRYAMFVAKWGSKGTGAGQFDMPYAVATDVLGNVYVVDKGNSRIQKFTPQGAFIRAWGGPGTGHGQFQNPQGIAVDAAGNVYVVDADDARVQRFNVRGEFLGQWGSSGTGPGQLLHPTGISTDSAGSVYVSDDGNDRVLKFTPSGELITTLGPATGSDRLTSPLGVAADGLGNVYLAEQPTTEHPGHIVKFKPTQ
jgi:sugar lactone lactonase YvrE